MRDARPHRVRRGRPDPVPGHRGRLPDRRLHGHRGPGRGQGLVPGRGPVQRAGGPDPRPVRALAHGPVDGVPRVRQPPGQLGGRDPRSTRGRGRWASTRSSSGCATSPGAATGSSRSTRRATATGRRSSGVAAERIGWGTPLPEGRGRGIAFGIKSGPTTGLSYSIVRLLADGSVVVYAGTSDMGQGARTVLAQVAAQELGAPLEWVTVVMGDTAIVPYDQQTSASRSTVLMGNAVLAACRDIQAQLRSMAARVHGVEEADVAVDAGVVRLPDGRELTPLEVLKAGPRAAGRRAHGPRRVAQGRRARTTRWAARRRSSSSTARSIEAYGRRGDGRRDDPPPRHRERRRQGAQPAPGPDAGRGRGDHGPRPHAHGAVPVRRRGPDPEPRRDRLPDPDVDGPPARARERVGRERRRPGPVRREGHERGRAAVRGPRGGLGRPRGDRAPRSGTLPLSPERVWHALQARRTDPR